jgi:DNA-binding MarR family transcriptional regulator
MNEKMSRKDYVQINQALFSLVNAYDKRNLQETKEETDPLSVSERGVLLVLGQKQPINQRHLADMMQLSPGPVSQYVQRLVVKGYIRKEQDQHDRRNWWLHLTPEGEKVYEYTVDGAVQYTKDLLASLSSEEQHQLRGYLLRIAKDLGCDW